MNVSAVPGCSALAGIAMQSVPSGMPSRALLERVVLGLLDLVADVDDVAVPAVVDPGVAADHVLDVVGRVAAQLRLEVERPLLGLLDLGLVLRVEVGAGGHRARAEDLLVVVEHVDAALRRVEPEVVPGAGQLDLVLAVDDPRRVERVGHRVVGARVVPRLGEVVVDRVGVLQLRLVEAQQLVALDQPLGPVRGREDHVVAVARAQLGHHAVHRVEVGLAHLDAVALLELLDQLRVEVLRPVEVDEVAVGLGLDAPSPAPAFFVVARRRSSPTPQPASPSASARPAPPCSSSRRRSGSSK